MLFPEIINYLLTVRYPGSETGKMNWVCYRGGLQVIIPNVPAGMTIPFTIRPLHGSYAWLGYVTSFGTDIVPNTFTGSVNQYGTTPYSGVLTQRLRDDSGEYFILTTEQEPTYLSITNNSPVGQRCECIGNFLVIPTLQDMVTIADALRRLHTSEVSERLLQQAVYLLGILSGQPQEPLPPVGGS